MGKKRGSSFQLLNIFWLSDAITSYFSLLVQSRTTVTVMQPAVAHK